MNNITKKIELIKFDSKIYLEDGKANYAKRSEIEKIVEKVSVEGYKNIFLMGIGGTEFDFFQFEYFAKKMSNVEITTINASDINILRSGNLTKDSVVITASESGTTKEIVCAAKWMTEEGIRVIAVTKKDSDLGKLSSYVVEPVLRIDQCEYLYIMESLLIYGLLYKRGDFDDYPEFADQAKEIFPNLLDLRKQFEEKADEIAKNCHNAPYTIFTGSGASWGSVQLFAECVLEEMQWVRTRPITSANFFHGTLELVEPGVPVIITKNEDGFRAEDTRVEEFCKKIGAEYYVFDTKQFALNGINDKFREMFAPWIVAALFLDRLGVHYERYTKHNLKYRRYYKQFDY
jgi:fructoselysine-6-phosphate deglycase